MTTTTMLIMMIICQGRLSFTLFTIQQMNELTNISNIVTIQRAFQFSNICWKPPLGTWWGLFENDSQVQCLQEAISERVRHLGVEHFYQTNRIIPGDSLLAYGTKQPSTEQLDGRSGTPRGQNSSSCSDGPLSRHHLDDQ